MFRVFAAHLTKHKPSVFLVIVGVLGIQIANIVAPLYLKDLFNVLATSGPSDTVVRELVGIIMVIGLWWFVRWAANRIEHFANLHLIVNVMSELSVNTFEYLLGHSHNFFISNFAGSLTHKVSRFSKAFQGMYESTVLQFIPTFLFIIGAVGVLYTRSHLLGLILGVWVVAFFAFQIYVTKLRQPLRLAHSQADTRITGTLADAISNQSTIALFSGIAHEKNILSKVVGEWRLAGIRSWHMDAIIWSIIGLFMIAIEVGLLYGAVMLWKEGHIVVGDFILIQAYLLTLFERLVGVQSDLRRFFDSMSDGAEMMEILKQTHEVPDDAGAQDLKVRSGEVSFKDINFYFNTDNPVLKNFNLTLAGGERVGLVGPSGAGKSTVTKLLLRLYDLQEGEISIDGQNIKHITQESLRNNIAFVPQEPVLFHRTLMENIRYGRRGASDEEVVEAARQAHCAEFISQLPQGYNTFVGERGVKLSGGERQRVAIARAILKNAPILILDEATSSLDSESEALIQDALEKLMKNKTSIVIAHRLSTIMKMDRIVVIEKGTIVAEGTHDELLVQGGLYKKLWSIQAGGFIIDEPEFAEEQKES